MGAAWGGERGGEPAAGRSNDEARGRRAGRRVSLFFDKSVLEVRIALVLGPWPAVHGEGGRLRSHGAPPALVGPVWSGRGEPRGRRRLQSAGVQRARARARERESERAKETARKRARQRERQRERRSGERTRQHPPATHHGSNSTAGRRYLLGKSYVYPLGTGYEHAGQARPGGGGQRAVGRREAICRGGDNPGLARAQLGCR